ncbi:MAG: OST-HTH/LOTUS domain-containing protein, partial [Gemmatimonadota bacterium]
YTGLTGLTKTTELSGRGEDPWILVKDAIAKMVSRDDVMRSDRLKQVMQEIDQNFDEKAIGFSKFSKFLAEASSRGLIELTKVGNGQYEVGPARGGSGGSGRSSSGNGRNRRGRGRRDSREGRGGGQESKSRQAASQPSSQPSSGDPLQDAYGVLRSALERLRDAGREPARDSDVKRKILEEQPDFDETDLGFPKFSRFLAQAEEHGVIRLDRGDAGNLDVSLPDGAAPGKSPAEEDEAQAEEPEARAQESQSDEAPEQSHGVEEREIPDEAGATVVDVLPTEPEDTGLRLGPRRGSTRRRHDEDVVPLFEGQAASAPETETTENASAQREAGATTTASLDLGELGLPNEPDSIVRYLTHRYRGVGEKTAETLVEHFGVGIFETMANDPDAISRVVPAGRAEQVLEAWTADYERRIGSKGSGNGSESGDRDGNRRRGRGRGRGRHRD